MTAPLRIEVDRRRCVVTGTCEMLAPDVFEVDDDGDLVVRADPVPADQLDAARRAVRECPTRALQLVDA